jgi:hypothetical protein
MHVVKRAIGCGAKKPHVRSPEHCFAIIYRALAGTRSSYLGTFCNGSWFTVWKTRRPACLVCLRTLGSIPYRLCYGR